MLRNLLLAALLFLVPAQAGAEPWWYRTSQVAAGTAHALDLGSTTDCIARGVCHETNIFYGRAKNPLVFSALKGSVATAGIIVADKAPNRKWGAVLNFTVAAFYSGLAYHNYKVSHP